MTDAHLFAALEEESVRVHTIGDSRSDEGEPVEDDAGDALLLWDEELVCDVDGYGESESEGEGGEDLERKREVLEDGR